MNIKIQSPHFTLNKGLNDFVTKKVKKLSRLYDRIEAGEVCLKLDKSDTDKNKICEIRLAVPGKDLFAKRKSDHFDKAVNETVDVLERQIEKMKTKFENHKR